MRSAIVTYNIHRDQNNIPQGDVWCLVKRVTVIVFCNVDRPITLLGVSCVELLSAFIVWGGKQKSQQMQLFFTIAKKRRTQFVKRRMYEESKRTNLCDTTMKARNSSECTTVK